MTLSLATVGGAMEHIVPIGLEELNAVASLQTRVDRKYIVAFDKVEGLLRALPTATRVLEIDGRRSFRYESVYFDTDDRQSYLGAAHGRPRRFKVRTRSYLDARTCHLEVKVRDRRDRTVKFRTDHDPLHPDLLSTTAVEFLRRFVEVEPFADHLAPVLVTRYRRTTLVLDGTRMTIDEGVVCRSRDGRRAGVRDAAIIETKSGLAASGFDRLLWAHALRPKAVSKFGAGLAALEPNLPSNKWRRTVREHVEVVNHPTM